jgi:signal transduction histidine kinase
VTEKQDRPLFAGGEAYALANPSQAESGMGLGLSVSRRLIDAMGGRIEVETGPGRGARFTAVFPRKADAPQEASHD